MIYFIDAIAYECNVKRQTIVVLKIQYHFLVIFSLKMKLLYALLMVLFAIGSLIMGSAKAEPEPAFGRGRGGFGHGRGGFGGRRGGFGGFGGFGRGRFG